MSKKPATEFDEGPAPKPRLEWTWLYRIKPGQSRLVIGASRAAVVVAVQYWKRKTQKKYAIRREPPGYRVYCLE